MKAFLRVNEHRVLLGTLGLGFAATFAACGQQSKISAVATTPLSEPPAAAVETAPNRMPAPPPRTESPAPAAEVVTADSPAVTVPAAPTANVLTAQQLDELVAAVALYPDPLLAQLLPASTYPLEVVQASRWAQANRGIKGADVEKALADRDWAQSVKALCAFPDVLKYMDEHLDWTTQLGDAVLGQEQDVLDAVQRMRLKAQAAGTLKSNDKQTVEVERTGDRTVVVVEPADPEVIYVPTYDPGVVYYPPRYAYVDAWGPGYIGFGLGVAVGSLFWSHDCDWYDRHLVYYHDYDNWWYDGHHRYRHCRIDWDHHDWDRFDWKHCDRFRHHGRDIDLRHVNIDNIDINHCDWRHSDFRRFDWNRVDWRRVHLDRVDLRHGDWRTMDWGRAGITDPGLVEKLRNLSPEDREWMRGRFERAHGNQKYKDLMANAQAEHRTRLSAGGAGGASGSARGAELSRWQHDPNHRRGVAYTGPATGFPATLERQRSHAPANGGVRSTDLTTGLSGRGRGGDRGTAGLSSRGGSGVLNAKGIKEVPKGFTANGGENLGHDQNRSNRIMDGLRRRGGDGNNDHRGNHGVDGLASQNGGGIPKAERVNEFPKGLAVNGTQNHGRDQETSNRIMEGFRQRGSDNRFRGNSAGEKVSNGGENRGNDGALRSTNRTVESHKRPVPQKDFQMPERQNFGSYERKNRDSNWNSGQTFKRHDGGDRLGSSGGSSFNRSSGSGRFEKRSYDRKSDGGFKFDGGNKGGNGGHGGGHGGSFKSDGGKSYSGGGGHKGGGGNKGGGGGDKKNKHH
ncbi:MAG TPA: DUF3300 domain-containing protein [Verrucomicrobiae bacterium]|nr:DUF3300 domain-containing protein [Verrucomicrobiae bacterium]